MRQTVCGTSGQSHGIAVDCEFAGGNIIVDSIDGDMIAVRQDLRDTETDWFYWYLRVRGAAGHTITVRFTASNVIGVRGPGMSTDGGKSWRWLGADSVEGQSFRCAVPPGPEEVRFSFGMPYLESNLNEFLARYRGDPHLEVGALCTTGQGRRVELLRMGRLSGACQHRVLLTCRHHCCEMMASYSLEGIMESILSDGDDGAWLRRNVEFVVVPFVDKDGTENGDQGKNRRPHDHNRDYSGESIHPAPRALRELVPQWSGGRLHVALDMHCPFSRGEVHERIHFVQGADAAQWEQVKRFSSILEAVQTGPLVFSSQDNLALGQAWNTPGNYAAGRSFSRWASELPDLVLATGIEIPYANASGQTVTAETARALGHDLARALCRFLQELRADGLFTL